MDDFKLLLQTLSSPIPDVSLEERQLIFEQMKYQKERLASFPQKWKYLLDILFNEDKQYFHICVKELDNYIKDIIFKTVVLPPDELNSFLLGLQDVCLKPVSDAKNIYNSFFSLANLLQYNDYINFYQHIVNFLMNDYIHGLKYAYYFFDSTKIITNGVINTYDLLIQFLSIINDNYDPNLILDISSIEVYDSYVDIAYVTNFSSYLPILLNNPIIYKIGLDVLNLPAIISEKEGEEKIIGISLVKKYVPIISKFVSYLHLSMYYCRTYNKEPEDIKESLHQYYYDNIIFIYSKFILLLYHMMNLMKFENEYGTNDDTLLENMDFGQGDMFFNLSYFLLNSKDHNFSEEMIDCIIKISVFYLKFSETELSDFENNPELFYSHVFYDGIKKSPRNCIYQIFNFLYSQELFQVILNYYSNDDSDGVLFLINILYTIINENEENEEILKNQIMALFNFGSVVMTRKDLKEPVDILQKLVLSTFAEYLDNSVQIDLLSYANQLVSCVNRDEQYEYMEDPIIRLKYTFGTIIAYKLFLGGVEINLDFIDLLVTRVNLTYSSITYQFFKELFVFYPEKTAELSEVFLNSSVLRLEEILNDEDHNCDNDSKIIRSLIYMIRDMIKLPNVNYSIGNLIPIVEILIEEKCDCYSFLVPLLDGIVNSPNIPKVESIEIYMKSINTENIFVSYGIEITQTIIPAINNNPLDFQNIENLAVLINCLENRMNDFEAGTRIDPNLNEIIIVGIEPPKNINTCINSVDRYGCSNVISQMIQTGIISDLNHINDLWNHVWSNLAFNKKDEMLQLSYCELIASIIMIYSDQANQITDDQISLFIETIKAYQFVVNKYFMLLFSQALGIINSQNPQTRIITFTEEIISGEYSFKNNYGSLTSSFSKYNGTYLFKELINDIDKDDDDSDDNSSDDD